ncbi:hypothetical protein BH09CHL1_BH09CHL1_24700 [soil metagenome]
MPLSQLVYARIQEGAGSPRIITLHKHFQLGADVAEYALAASPDARIIGLESSKGIYVEQVIRGYTWFLGPLDRPAPFFFGDALAEIERFLWDEVDRQSGDQVELPFLLGVEQGAIMALAAAAAVPNLLSGVIAIDASFPTVPGWDPPLAPLNGLPILLAESSQNSDQIAEEFQDWGGEVSIAAESGDEIRDWLTKQPVRMLER